MAVLGDILFIFGGFRAMGDRQNRAMVSTSAGVVVYDLDEFGYPYVT